MQRAVTALLGPTNTGKTHLAIERMLTHRTGAIGFPLRLLARENYDKVKALRGPDAVALVTGEERIVPKQPAYWMCTVEAMPPDLRTDFLAVDEVQLAADRERGHVFTDRILNARGRLETWLIGAETARRLLHRLLPDASFTTRPRLSSLRSRRLPLAATLVIVLLAPNLAFGTAYLAPRFALFLLPALLFALERGPVPARRGAYPALLAAVAVLLVAGVASRFLGLAREGAGLAEVLAAAPGGGRLLYLGYDRGSRYSPDTPFLHSGMLHAVDRCGVAEPSFARGFQQPVRYRPGRVAPLPDLVQYAPYRFRWDRHGGADYDLFLVRSVGAPDLARIGGGDGRLVLRAHEGRWWLYDKATRRAPAR